MLLKDIKENEGFTRNDSNHLYLKVKDYPGKSFAMITYGDTVGFFGKNMEVCSTDVTRSDILLICHKFRDTLTIIGNDLLGKFDSTTV